MPEPLHVDVYAINNANSEPGQPYLKPGGPIAKIEPGIGLTIPGYYPHSNGYTYEIEPHADGECPPKPEAAWERSDFPRPIKSAG